ncbi:MAG: methylmalonyl Co-A mutase-associated GTPase MeaB [Bacteroidota bacterium]
MTVSQLAKGIKAGKRRPLAKGITLVESSHPSDQEQAAQLLTHLAEDRDTIRIGVSGVPGVGKSTFIEAFGNHLIAEGHRVAVLAVDPSSPTTGGSILGDKTRMETLSSREEAFIRPSPTSGTLGGVAKRTRETMLLCEAGGYDVILVETVGVGQSEFEVSSMVDCFMMLMLPGAGDGLQGIKRGIMEITDVMVINKADGDQEKLALQAKSEYEHAFHFLQTRLPDIPVRFHAVSALKNKGITEVWSSILQFIDALKQQGFFNEQRMSQNLSWFKRLAEDALIEELWRGEHNREMAEQLKKGIINNEILPSVAAKKMVSIIKKADSN